MGTDSPTKIRSFRDLGDAVVKAWERAGYGWQDMVEGYGAGSGGAGMPPQEMFEGVAEKTVDAELVGQPESELRRLMRSRLYQRHCDFDSHWGFTHGNEDYIERWELISNAVWEYLLAEMERQYAEQEEADDGEDEEDEDDNWPQLTLPGDWPERVSVSRRSRRR